MAMTLKIVGIAFIVFGLADLLGSYAEVDVWGGVLGVQLPDLLWQYSAYIEIALGYLAFKGSSLVSASNSKADVSNA